VEAVALGVVVVVCVLDVEVVTAFEEPPHPAIANAAAPAAITAPTETPLREPRKPSYPTTLNTPRIQGWIRQ
jgi:hypothetical protein